MKKIVLSLMIFLLLVGCSNAQNIENEQLARYESYWNSLLNETTFMNASRNFNIEGIIQKSGDLYEYYVVIDEPKTAMYDVEIMIIENKSRFDEYETMVPSVGIFDAMINMVPYQVRKESNYREGAALGRQELSNDEVTLQIMVMWKNYTKLESFKEVFELSLKYETEVVETNDVENEETEATQQP